MNVIENIRKFCCSLQKILVLFSKHVISFVIQGGYVLYRLFNKEEERTSVKDENETDEIISSPVGERQNEAQQDGDLQEAFPCLPEFGSSTLRPSHPDKCLADLADSSVTSSIATLSTFDEGLKVKQ